MRPRRILIELATEDATTALAARIAPALRAGDTVLLGGPIGAGKSHFARALIRTRLGNPAEDVPSPTFTLVQTYSHHDADIWHCDLYRLTGPDELIELGLDEAFATAICLIEWPDRLGDMAPLGALEINFAAGEDAFSAIVDMPGDWPERLETVLAD